MKTLLDMPALLAISAPVVDLNVTCLLLGD